MLFFQVNTETSCRGCHLVWQGRIWDLDEVGEVVDGLFNCLFGL